MSIEVTMKDLLEAGVHFGHQTKRWNPKMKPYIFTERNDIYIIDLQKTLDFLSDAYEFVKNLAAEGGNILFVGTKKQTRDSIYENAVRADMPFVNYRWLGGMLTNWKTISKRINYLNELEEKKERGELDYYPKKEQMALEKELDKLKRNLGGIRMLNRLPDALFVIDTNKEEIAVKEATKLEIPIVAVVDTNSDPDPIDYIIPGNDDAIRSDALFSKIIADAVIEGRGILESKAAEEEEVEVEEAKGISVYEAKEELSKSRSAPPRNEDVANEEEVAGLRVFEPEKEKSEEKEKESEKTKEKQEEKTEKSKNKTGGKKVKKKEDKNN